MSKVYFCLLDIEKYFFLLRKYFKDKLNNYVINKKDTNYAVVLRQMF